ncbi:MAG: hypothetical protein ACD_69C00267G0001, partial [uncultured bacterium]
MNLTYKDKRCVLAAWQQLAAPQ